MAVKLPEGVKRKDMHMVDPNVVVVCKGWNPRKFDKRTDEQIQKDAEFKQFVIDNGPKFPPIYVSQNGDGVVELVDGERRLRATLGAIEAGAVIEGIPAIFVPRNTNDIEKLALALTANQGEPLTPLEEAEACKRMKDWGVGETDIAKMIGKSISHVNNRLVLVQASPAVKEAVEEGTITQGEAMDAVKQSEGSIEKQDEKLEKIRKPTAQKAPKMMSRLKVGKQLEAMADEVAETNDLNEFIEGLADVQKKYCAMIGMAMILKNIEFDEAESEVFIAISHKQSVNAVDDGQAPWTN